jgi:hypothetical protein
MPSFLTRYLNRRAFRSSRRERCPVRRPLLELLEDRLTPSNMGTIHLTNGVDGDPLPIPPASNQVSVAEQTKYLAKQDVYGYGNNLVDGYYDVEVVDPGGKSQSAPDGAILGVSDPNSPVQVSGGHFVSGPGLISGPRGTAFNVWNEVYMTSDGITPDLTQQGYADTGNNGGVYQVVLAQHSLGELQDNFAQVASNNSETKSKNFKVGEQSSTEDQTAIVTTYTISEPNGSQVSASSGAVVALGSTVSDTATVTDTTHPSTTVNEGSVDFQLSYSPDGIQPYTVISEIDDVPVSGGTATSGAFVDVNNTPIHVVAGFYNITASYTDGTTFEESESADEPFQAQKVTFNVTLSTTADPTGTIRLPGNGSTVTLKDNSTVGGLPDASLMASTGSIAYTLNGISGDAASLTIPSPTDTATGLTGYANNETPNGFKLPTNKCVTGTYGWSAMGKFFDIYGNEYDGSELPDSQGNYDPLETTTVAPAQPTLSTTPGGIVTANGVNQMSDTISLTGGYFFHSATNNLHVVLNNPSGSAVYTANVPINTLSYGYAQTFYYTPPAGATPGTYQWVVTYDGDCNNLGAKSLSGQEPEILVSTSTGTPKTLGFWGNKNGQAILQAHDSAWRTLVNSLSLRNADGTQFTVPTTGTFTTAYKCFATWLQAANATNMAYMLSAQLVTMELNVAYMSVGANELLYIGPNSAINAWSNNGQGSNLMSKLNSGASTFSLTGTDSNGFITIAQVEADAIYMLQHNGKTTASGPARLFEEALKIVLDAANNDLPIYAS